MGFRELGKPREQLGQGRSWRPPLLGSRATLGGWIRVLRPAFDCFVRVRSILSRNFAKVVVHPIVHVLHDLPDGMRIVRYGSGCQLGRKIFDAGDGIHVSAFAVHEFAECGVAHTFRLFARIFVERGLAPSRSVDARPLKGHLIRSVYALTRTAIPWCETGRCQRRRGEPRLYGSVILSPTLIVPCVRICARNPPRCSRPLITDFPVTFCKWSQGSHRRMPRIRTSPIANSLPTR